MGSLEMFLIYQTGDIWEPEWEPLRKTAFAGMFPTVTDEVMNQALQGWTNPLVGCLGLPPIGCLKKLPKEHRACDHRVGCPFYTPECVPTSATLPDCYHPENLPDDMTRTLAYEGVRLWREGVYIVVVKEMADAYRTYPKANR